MDRETLLPLVAEAITNSNQLKIKLVEHEQENDDHYVILNPHSIIIERESGIELLRGIVTRSVIQVVGGCNNFPLPNIVTIEVLETLFAPDPQCSRIARDLYQYIYPVAP